MIAHGAHHFRLPAVEPDRENDHDSDHHQDTEPVASGAAAAARRVDIHHRRRLVEKISPDGQVRCQSGLDERLSGSGAGHIGIDEDLVPPVDVNFDDITAAAGIERHPGDVSRVVFEQGENFLIGSGSRSGRWVAGSSLRRRRSEDEHCKTEERREDAPDDGFLHSRSPF
ncbi:MAG: hypothetical protein IPM23_00520 [Candidatus Melainabacteria bacterium]|nr:hypothetical protein [Candidatus Melainabacteria bacterium]